MGPKQTRTLAIVVGAVAVLGSVCQAAAQNFAGDDPLSIRMPDDAADADVELIVEIAARLGVPFGFEAAGALSDRVSMPFRTLLPTPRPASRPGRLVSRRPQRLDIRGVTLREALDAVVVKDPRYEWRFIDGVAVVRPASSWRDPEHPLLRTLSEGTSLFDHVNAIARTAGAHWSLRSKTSTILLDGGRAVTVAEPMLTIDSPAGSRGIPVWR